MSSKNSCTSASSMLTLSWIRQARACTLSRLRSHSLADMPVAFSLTPASFKVLSNFATLPSNHMTSFDVQGLLSWMSPSRNSSQLREPSLFRSKQSKIWKHSFCIKWMSSFSIFSTISGICIISSNSARPTVPSSLLSACRNTDLRLSILSLSSAAKASVWSCATPVLASVILPAIRPVSKETNQSPPKTMYIIQKSCMYGSVLFTIRAGVDQSSKVRKMKRVCMDLPMEPNFRKRKA
mmetsp:Transcript_53365/g.114697  ORF Transcript_53365/g.114697 Transcript_53365/m.114697 type:complete len:238 (+) Transcript_53365:126-839(+)